MKDLDIEYNAEDGINDDTKKLINDKYKRTGQDRSKYDGGWNHRTGKQSWIFIPEATARDWSSPFLPPTRFAELKKLTK